MWPIVTRDITTFSLCKSQQIHEYMLRVLSSSSRYTYERITKKFTLFLQWFNSNILSSTCFEQPSFHYQEFYDILSCIYISSLVTDRMCLISNISWQWLDCLYRWKIKCHKAACTVFLMMNTCFFETCRRLTIHMRHATHQETDLTTNVHGLWR